jgi:hypothetical protein
MPLQKTPHALALLSGGLDSLLAARLVQEQGVAVHCLHFVSPFFGKPEQLPRWEKLFDLSISAVDISEEFARLLVERPKYGFGSVLNPCVDCKILMMRHARRLMEESGACCLISGEVLGQRPMSQRRDTLNVIRRDAGLKGKLLRPLCALHMEETDAERAGIIDRQKLLGFSGRGRKDQLALAERFRLPEIPTPGGGCRLTETEKARSYWPILKYIPAPAAADFFLANTGRQLWRDEGAPPAYWLIIGRNQEDNTVLSALAAPGDLLLKVENFPGPLALGRRFSGEWPADAVTGAAAVTSSYSTKAVRHANATGEPVAVRVHTGSPDAPGTLVNVSPNRSPAFAWREYSWDGAREEIRQEARG